MTTADEPASPAPLRPLPPAAPHRHYDPSGSLLSGLQARSAPESPTWAAKRTRRNVYSLRDPSHSFGCPGHEVTLHSEGRSALPSRALVRCLVPAERALRIW